MSEVYIVSASRTAVGSLGKSLNNISADKLGASVISDAIIYMHTEIRAKLQSLAKSNINQAPDPIDKPAVSGKQKKQGGPQGATFE